jgi:hypothetical protein
MQLYYKLSDSSRFWPWANTGDIRRIFCIHGEESQCLAHAETLRAMKPKANVLVLEYRQVVEI